MSVRWVAAVGGAVSFVVAAIAGVVGNQLGKNASWAWVAFGIVLVLGIVVTGWTAYRTASSDAIAHAGGGRGEGVTHSGDVEVGGVSADGGQAVGVNYGSMTQTHRRDPDAPR